MRTAYEIVPTWCQSELDLESAPAVVTMLYGSIRAQFPPFQTSQRLHRAIANTFSSLSHHDSPSRRAQSARITVFYFLYEHMSGYGPVDPAKLPTYFYTHDLIALHHNSVNPFVWEFNQLHRRSVRMSMNNSQLPGRSNAVRIILSIFSRQPSHKDRRRPIRKTLKERRETTEEGQED